MKQREIKFRAWDKVDKKMRKWEDLRESPMYLLQEMDSIIFLQYTGLKDKNGKEIYEGDILDCIYKFDGCKKHKLQVFYQEELAKFRLKDIGECHQPRVTKTMGDMTRSKVIGNIYENPDLLKL